MTPSSGWRQGSGSSGPTLPTCTSQPSAGCRLSRLRLYRFPRSWTRGCGRRWSRAASASCTPIRRRAFDHALAGRHVVVVTPTASGKTLCYNAPILHAVLQDPSSRALYLFPTKALAQDQLAELQATVRDHRGDRRPGHRRVHLRRRHAAGRASQHPRPRAPGAQQSGHGALGHPAAPSALGEAVRESPLRRHRRAACVSRRVRQPSVQCAAAAAPHLPPLWIRSGVPLLVGDDCQSAGAGRAADRAPVRAGRSERRAARREVLRLRQSAGGQSSARDPPLVPQRNTAGGRRVPEAQPAADRLRAEPAGHRDSDDLSQGRFRERARGARARFAAIAAATCRTADAKSRRDCATARCARWCRPTRSSWASTSVRSTSR